MGHGPQPAARSHTPLQSVPLGHSEFKHHEPTPPEDTYISTCSKRHWYVDCVWNVMAHAQKPDFVFRQNGGIHLNRQGRQLTTGSPGVCISGNNAGYTMFRGSVKGTGYPLHSPVSLHFPSCASPCAITFQMDSTTLRIIWHSEGRASWYILIMKANEMHYFRNLLDKVLYIFRTIPLSIIRSISTLYTRNRYLSCYFCWLSACVVSSILTSLADSQQN